MSILEGDIFNIRPHDADTSLFFLWQDSFTLIMYICIHVYWFICLTTTMALYGTEFLPDWRRCSQRRWVTRQPLYPSVPAWVLQAHGWSSAWHPDSITRTRWHWSTRWQATPGTNPNSNPLLTCVHGICKLRCKLQPVTTVLNECLN